MRVEETNTSSAIGWFALFASTGTLLCCALPILLVSFGFGAVVASLTSSFPLLVTLTEYETWMFSISALLLGGTAWIIWFRPQSCPADPVLADHCERSKVWNKRIFWVAISIWSVGFISAFLLLPIRNLIGI